LDIIVIMKLLVIVKNVIKHVYHAKPEQNVLHVEIQIIEDLMN